MKALKNFFKGSAMGLGCLCHLALGCLYAHAIANGIHAWTGIWWFLSGIIGFMLALSPFLGTLLSVISAVKVWGWSMFYSISVFVLLPLVVLFIWGLLIKIFDR